MEIIYQLNKLFVSMKNVKNGFKKLVARD